MTTLYDRLLTVAQNRTNPFCYSCYERAPSGRCSNCGSDDLMVELTGVGVEYNFDWVIHHLLDEHVPVADIDSAFDDFVADCYSETVKIGWVEYDTATALKTLDPVSWRMARDEFIDCECEANTLCTFDNGTNYYWVSEVEKFVVENLHCG